ncbi:MAG: hypothetical protein F6K31_25345 [Symploca sp. SIO2G7]|nr:hypothetical protein [Symploca sp. SIO2G7]
MRTVIRHLSFVIGKSLTMFTFLNIVQFIYMYLLRVWENKSDSKKRQQLIWQQPTLNTQHSTLNSQQPTVNSKVVNSQQPIANSQQSTANSQQ